MQSKLIRNRDRAAQQLAFDGMKYGLCRPTDMDMSIDFQGKCWVFGEIKGAGTGLTMGQKIHLSGLVKAIRKAGLTAYAFLAHHEVEDTDHDVMVGDCEVFTVFNGSTWTRTSGTVHELITQIHDEHTERKNK